MQRRRITSDGYTDAIHDILTPKLTAAAKTEKDIFALAQVRYPTAELWVTMGMALDGGVVPRSEQTAFGRGLAACGYVKSKSSGVRWSIGPTLSEELALGMRSCK